MSAMRCASGGSPSHNPFMPRSLRPRRSISRAVVRRDTDAAGRPSTRGGQGPTRARQRPHRHQRGRQLTHALRAYDLASTGRRIGAEEALRLGLATEVVAAEALSERARDRAAELAAGPRLAQALTKRLLRTAQVDDLPTTMALEARSQGTAALGEDHLRLRTAFLAG